MKRLENSHSFHSERTPTHGKCSPAQGARYGPMVSGSGSGPFTFLKQRRWTGSSCLRTSLPNLSIGWNAGLQLRSLVMSFQLRRSKLRGDFQTHPLKAFDDLVYAFRHAGTELQPHQPCTILEALGLPSPVNDSPSQ